MRAVYSALERWVFKYLNKCSLTKWVLKNRVRTHQTKFMVYNSDTVFLFFYRCKKRLMLLKFEENSAILPQETAGYSEYGIVDINWKNY